MRPWMVMLSVRGRSSGDPTCCITNRDAECHQADTRSPTGEIIERSNDHVDDSFDVVSVEAVMITSFSHVIQRTA